jgi:poly-gamma-glutamate capsule biosynthesis protein CapA/YwtB (metallophosphatase superfamily)
MPLVPEQILFLCGDVMTGRGIDQILPHPSRPHLYESYVRSALGYVELAERVSGPIPRPVDYAYIWGDALDVLDETNPDARIINLETAVTTSEEAWPGKGIHYRMHPANLRCIAAASIHCCVLANNHVLDWGYLGLQETLYRLRAAGIPQAGAGRDEAEAARPTLIQLQGSRVQVFAFGMENSGVSRHWAAGADRPGVNYLPDLSPRTADAVAQQVRVARGSGDIAVVSLHWGANWGYEVPPEHRAFAHRLIDGGGADVVHGHSSHHPMGIEIYRERPILYGCGDFLNDYEGIHGHEAYRPELTLMYFAAVDASTGALSRLVLTPMQVRRFRLNRAPEEEASWLLGVLDSESRRLGTRVQGQDDGNYRVVPAS